MELPVLGKDSSISVSSVLFGHQEMNDALIHQVVGHINNHEHTGSKKLRTRSMVSGSTKKIRKQKGSGRARMSTMKTNIWRGGGVAFNKTGTRPTKINKKMYRKAMQHMFSHLKLENRIYIIENFDFLTEAKTKLMKSFLESHNLSSVLFVVDGDISENLYYSARNLVNVCVVSSEIINLIDLMKYDNIVLASSVMKDLEEKFG